MKQALSQQSVRVLRVVGHLGLATRPQIHRYLYRGKADQNSQPVIAALEDKGEEDEGFIHHHEVNFGPGHATYLYRLTKRGYYYLTYPGKVPRSEVIKTTEIAEEPKREWIDHHLECIEILIKLHELSRSHSQLQVVRSYTEPLLRRRQIAGVIPDLWVQLRCEQEFVFSFEWDRGTINLNKLPDRLRNDLALMLQVDDYMDAFGTKQLERVWILQDQTRRDQVLDAMEDLLESRYDNHDARAKAARLWLVGSADPNTTPSDLFLTARFYQPFKRKAGSLLPGEGGV